MILYKKPIVLFLYGILLAAFALYSYVLLDLNLTIFNSPLWENFRNTIIQIGYFQRDLSTTLYLVFILFLFIFHFLLVKLSYNPLKVAFLVGIILLFSYPFLSHDFFNYMFDAKILTVYQKNPYLYRALDFPSDPWLLFMHWTHRTYPYGPVFLPLTLIPSFLSFGKLILNMLFFKAMFIAFYFFAVYVLNKLHKTWALFFATHPLILIEGIVNAHNDLIGVSLAIIGIYFLAKQKNVWGRIFLIASAGIKYITFPLIFLIAGNKKINAGIFAVLAAALLYLWTKSEVQPWYFLALFAAIPFYGDLVRKLNIFFAGLLFSYYPYIRFGGWDTAEKVALKHQIIYVFLALNVLVIVMLNLFQHLYQGKILNQVQDDKKSY